MRANGVVCLDRERPDRCRYAGTLIERLRSLESRGLFGLLNARTSRISRPRQSAADLALLVVELVVRMPATVPAAGNDHDDNNDHDDDSTYDHYDCGPASASATCDDHDHDHDNDHDDNNDDHRSTNHDDDTRPGAHRLESSTARASSGLDRTLR